MEDDSSDESDDGGAEIENGNGTGNAEGWESMDED